MSYGFGDMYTYENSSGNGVLLAGRQIGRRSQGEGCTPATLRTFLQLTISRTSIGSPLKLYERYRAFSVERKISFPAKGSLRSLAHPLWNSRNFLRDGSRWIAEDRRGTIPRRLLAFSTSRRRGRIARTHEAGIAQDLHELYVRRYHILPGAMRRTGIMPGAPYTVS